MAIRRVSLHTAASPEDELKRHLAALLLAWCKAQDLPADSQRPAFQRIFGGWLGWRQQYVSHLVMGKLDKLSIDVLLRAWKRIGGQAQLQLKPPSITR